jgi:hypothetical protein
MKTRYTLLMIAFLSSCMFQEELDPDDQEFRGSWDSSKYAIQIFMNGHGTCDIKYLGQCNGNVKVKGSKLVFTSTRDNDQVGYKKFHIDQRPTTDSLGVTYMILDGHKLSKQ